MGSIGDGFADAIQVMLPYDQPMSVSVERKGPLNRIRTTFIFTIAQEHHKLDFASSLRFFHFSMEQHASIHRLYTREFPPSSALFSDAAISQSVHCMILNQPWVYPVIGPTRYCQ